MSSKFKLGDSVTIVRGDHMYCGLQGKITAGRNPSGYYQFMEDGTRTYNPIYLREGDMWYTEEILETKAAVAEQLEKLAPVEEEPTVKQVGGDHYLLPIQPVDYIYYNEIPYLEGNVIKYVTRHRNKNGRQDIEKAIHYLEMILDREYAEDEAPF